MHTTRGWWEKAMAPHSSTLAWKIPRTEEPGRLQSMGSRRVGHAWATDFTFTFHFDALEKEMTTPSSVLAWRIPGMGSHRVRHNWNDLAAVAGVGDCSHETKRRLLLGRKVMTNLDSILKSRNITLPTKVCLVKLMVFPVVMYGCESWTVKKSEHQRRCFWTVVLEKALESPLDCKEIQPVHPKGDQSWVFIGRADAEAEAPILWPPDAKNWLIGKNWKRLKAGGEGDDGG